MIKNGNEDERLNNISNTAGWKFQMTALIKKENKYLQDVYAISFINLGSWKDNSTRRMRKIRPQKRKHDDSTYEEETVTEDEEMDGNDNGTESIGGGEFNDAQNMVEEPESLMDKILISAGNGSIFISWEPWRINQYYFLTTKEYGKEAVDWFDVTMRFLVWI